MKRTILVFFLSMFLGTIAVSCSHKKKCNSCPDWGMVESNEVEQA